MTGEQAYVFCRDLAARSGTPQDDDCRRALSGGVPRNALNEAGRPSYAAGRDDAALAGASRDRRDTVIRCIERTVDGVPVTACR